MSITIKSLSVDISVFHVGCPKASDVGCHPTMVFSERCHSGKVFKCTGCGVETSINIRVNDNVG